MYVRCLSIPFRAVASCLLYHVLVGFRKRKPSATRDRILTCVHAQSVQDELASLNLQFNMAEERASKFERENQELVDRWMALKEKQADALNEASKFA
jgi:hypothetical protein